MKKSAAILLGLLLLFLAAGCGERAQESPSVYYSFSEPPTAAPTAPPTLPPTAAPTAATTHGDVPTSDIVRIVAIYNTVYNNTKSDPGFLGSDALTISNVMLDDRSNSAVDGIIRSVLDRIYTPRTLPLPPYSETNPFPQCIFTAEDAQSATWQDNGDGTALLTIVPKTSVNSSLGEGQGKMFNVITNMQDIFGNLPGTLFTWSEGDVNDNVTTTYSGGSCTIRYDKTTMKMLSARYEMLLHIGVKNLKVLFMSHSAGLDISYIQTFPATA